MGPAFDLSGHFETAMRTRSSAYLKVWDIKAAWKQDKPILAQETDIGRGQNRSVPRKVHREDEKFTQDSPKYGDSCQSLYLNWLPRITAKKRWILRHLVEMWNLLACTARWPWPQEQPAVRHQIPTNPDPEPVRWRILSRCHQPVSSWSCQEYRCLADKMLRFDGLSCLSVQPMTSMNQTTA